MVLSPDGVAQPPLAPAGGSMNASAGSSERLGGIISSVLEPAFLWTIAIPARTIYDRLASSVGVDHLHRGFLATLYGGAIDTVNGYKQLWREDGIKMFIKWPLLGFGVGAGVYVVQESVQCAYHEILGVTEEDIESRSLKWHLSKSLSLLCAGAILHPGTVMWSYCTLRKMPSWKTFLYNYMWRGENYFYTPLPFSSLSFLMFFINDIIRAKMLHCVKRFFPDHVLRSDPYDEEVNPLKEPHKSYLYNASTIAMYVVSCMIAAFLTTPLDSVVVRIIASPHIYGPLGVLGTCRSIASEEGFWGFYKGFVCNVLFLLNSYYTNVQEEAATGKVCV